MVSLSRYQWSIPRAIALAVVAGSVACAPAGAASFSLLDVPPSSSVAGGKPQELYLARFEYFPYGGIHFAFVEPNFSLDSAPLLAGYRFLPTFSDR